LLFILISINANIPRTFHISPIHLDIASDEEASSTFGPNFVESAEFRGGAPPLISK
jgi:hypothetical protein